VGIWKFVSYGADYLKICILRCWLSENLCLTLLIIWKFVSYGTDYMKIYILRCWLSENLYLTVLIIWKFVSYGADYLKILYLEIYIYIRHFKCFKLERNTRRNKHESCQEPVRELVMSAIWCWEIFHSPWISEKLGGMWSNHYTLPFETDVKLWRSCWSASVRHPDKAIPLHAWTGPEGSRKLRLPDFKQSAHESGKVVSPTHRPPLPPWSVPGTHFC